MLQLIVRCMLPEMPEIPAAARRAAAGEAMDFVETALGAAPFHIRAANSNAFIGEGMSEAFKDGPTLPPTPLTTWHRMQPLFMKI